MLIVKILETNENTRWPAEGNDILYNTKVYAEV